MKRIGLIEIEQKGRRKNKVLKRAYLDVSKVPTSAFREKKEGSSIYPFSVREYQGSSKLQLVSGGRPSRRGCEVC